MKKARVPWEGIVFLCPGGVSSRGVPGDADCCSVAQSCPTLWPHGGDADSAGESCTPSPLLLFHHVHLCCVHHPCPMGIAFILQNDKGGVILLLATWVPLGLIHLPSLGLTPCMNSIKVGGMYDRLFMIIWNTPELGLVKYKNLKPEGW